MMAESLVIASHNVLGFENNRDYIHRRCDDGEIIMAIQEHWLRPQHKSQPGVSKLRSAHLDYEGFGTSGMDIESKITRGRPFGGTGWLWPKRLLPFIKPRYEYKHKRVTVMQINSRKKILLINVYFPFYNSSNIAFQEKEYCDTLG